MLFDSIKYYHPEWKLVFLLVDEPSLIPKEITIQFDLLLPMKDLLNKSKSAPQPEGWLFVHDIVELSTALKAKALVHLLSQDDCDAVLYFDPDMMLFSSLSDLTDSFNLGDILLTPHLTKQEANDDLAAIRDNEISCLKHGTFNLGFIGVKKSKEGKRFALWWQARTHEFCRDDIPNGLFTDQKWIDLVPAMFESHYVLRNERYNVATWNYSSRKLSGNVSEGIRVNHQKLGFYHFTGIDSGAHEIMARRYAKDNETSNELIEWYKNKLQQSHLDRKDWTYNYYRNGVKIKPLHRHIYRSIISIQSQYPDPYDTSNQDCFYQWVKYRQYIFRFIPATLILFNYKARHNDQSFYSLWKNSVKNRGYIQSVKLLLKSFYQ